MDYKKIHDQIIEKRKSIGEPEGYTEIHHIVPKSFGGSDDSENLLKMTAREHFIIHRLLAKIYPKTGMVHAVWKMSCVGKERYKVTSRTYSYLREQHAYRVSNDKESSKKKSDTMKGRKQTPEHSAKRAESRKKNGEWHSEETKEKIGKSNMGKRGPWAGKTLPKEAVEKRNKARHENGNYSWTEEQKRRASERQSGKKKGPMPEGQKEKLRKTYIVDGNIIVANAKEYCKENNIRYQKFISAANSGKPYKGLNISKM